MPGGVEVGGPVVDEAAVAEHRALDVEHVGPVPVAPARQLPEHDREHRPPDRRRRVDREVPVTDGPAHRRADER